MNVMKNGVLTASLLSAFAVTAVAQDRVESVAGVRAPATSDAGYFKASDLIGMEVRGTNNQDLGEVQDLFIDRRTHQVEYLILDTGVFADLDGKQPIIPWMIVETQAGPDAGTHFLSIPVTQERLKSSPTVVLSDVDLTTRSPQWVSQVDQFYSAELKQRRVSRPDLDQSRDRAAPQSQRQNRNASDFDANRAKPDATEKPKAPAAPKKPTNP